MFCIGAKDALQRAQRAVGSASSGARIIANSHDEMDEIATTVQSASGTITHLRVQSDKISGGV